MPQPSHHGIQEQHQLLHGHPSGGTWTKEAFVKHLAYRGTLVIDGGLATRLEQRGNNVSGPLWSGLVLWEHPEEVEEVHLEYYLADADVAITASYQLSTAGILKALHDQNATEEDAVKLYKKTVYLAQKARSRAAANGHVRAQAALVAGSIGPYGACLADGSEYRGDYHISNTAMKDFHRPRIRALIDAGADLLALETIPSIDEIVALLELLDEDFSNTIAWLSCTMKDEQYIADGTPLSTVLRYVNQSSQIVAFGVNCVPPGTVTAMLRNMSALTTLPLLCYPNSGESWDGQSKQWTGASNGVRIASKANEWCEAGARLIGGCCRTTPLDIHALANILRADPSHDGTTS